MNHIDKDDIKFIIKLVIVIVLAATLISTTVVFAYFQFHGDQAFVVSMEAEIPSAFGRFPADILLAAGVTSDENWGNDPRDPYLIENQIHFMNLETLNNRGLMDDGGYFFRLEPEWEDPATGLRTLDMDDIEIGCIGSEEYPFKNEFDGGGNVIKNLTVTANEGEIDIGMFSKIVKILSYMT